MNELRRRVLKFTGGALAAAAGLAGVGGAASAANRNEAALSAKSVDEALKQLGISDLIDSKDITIVAPDIAENGAIVPVAITSKIPRTSKITIIAEKNPFPLAATFDITPATEPYVSTRLKMGETSKVRAIVTADGKYYTAAKEVKVTVGGCG